MYDRETVREGERVILHSCFCFWHTGPWVCHHCISRIPTAFSTSLSSKKDSAMPNISQQLQTRAYTPKKAAISRKRFVAISKEGLQGMILRTSVGWDGAATAMTAAKLHYMENAERVLFKGFAMVGQNRNCRSSRRFVAFPMPRLISR